MEQHKNKPNNSGKESNGLEKKLMRLNKKLMRRNKKLMRFIETLKRISNKLKTLREKLNSSSNMTVMLIAGVISIELMYLLIQYFPKWISLTDKVQESAGYWNFLIVLISVPVALVVWHFRDENNRQQIENQRKDINLKEFQKLSEWVSGAHLPEIKIVNKTTQKSSPKDGSEITEQTTEQSEEYAKKPDAADFDTFSKRDGAVALQISAIYNLLPFFRGDYGKSFRLPAFCLLKSAWQAMQQDSLKKLDGAPLSDEERKKIFDELTQKAKSPMGMALTQVLLSLNQERTRLNLRDFPEMLPNICLAGMNFHLSGVSEISRDLSDLNLNGADFREAKLEKTKFQNSELIQAKLDNADLKEVNLQSANLIFAKLQEAKLTEANLQGADLRLANLQRAKLGKANLQKAKLGWANLRGADLQEVDLQKLVGSNWKLLKASSKLSRARITTNDFIQKIYPDWKGENNSKWDELKEDEKTKAMQKFSDETGMLIFDKSGRQIMPPP